MRSWWIYRGLGEGFFSKGRYLSVWLRPIACPTYFAPELDNPVIKLKFVIMLLKLLRLLHKESQVHSLDGFVDGDAFNLL